MRTLRLSLCCLFAFSGICCLTIVARYLRIALSPQNIWGAHSIFPGLIVPVVFSVFAFVFLMACWAGFREKPSAKGWGIAASIVNIQAALFPAFLYLRYDHDGAGLSVIAAPFLIVLGAGVCGLIVFARSLPKVDPQVKASESASVQGDGTLVWINKIAVLLLFALVYGVDSVWMRWARDRGLWSEWGFLRDNAVFLAAITIIVVTHEMGHAVAGFALGMKLRLFALGPFQWSRSKGKWRFEFQPKMTLRREGVVGMVPVSARTPRWHGAIIAAAGPAVNLIGGAIALIVVGVFDHDSLLQLGGRLGLFGALSIAIAIGNLIPFRIGRHYSDGARFYQHLSSNPFCDFYRVLQTVAAVSETPLRPRDYDLEAIQRALVAFPGGNEGHYLKLYIYDHYFDKGSITEACKALEDAEAIYNASALCAETEVSFILGHAALRSDAKAARLWWERLEQRTPNRSESDFWLAKCAFDCIDGRPEDAKAALQQVDLLIAKSQSTGSRAFDLEWATLLRHAIN